VAVARSATTPREAIPQQMKRNKWDTVPLLFHRNSLKRKNGAPKEAGHFFKGFAPRIPALSTAFLAIFLQFLPVTVPATSAQTAAPSKIPGDLASDLREFVETPSVSGYENQLSEKIGKKLAAFHPVVDNLGDVIVTIGSGTPRRLIVTPIDEPGFVVSGITDDGYLRLQRLPQSGLPPIYNALYSAQPVKVGVTGGKWIDGVVAGISVHLHPTDEPAPGSNDIENMYVDIGAASPAEARKAGVDILSPVAINRQLNDLAGKDWAAASVGDKFGAAVLAELLRDIDPAKIKGTLTVAFVTQQRTGARGLQRILNTQQADEMVYVGRMLPGGSVPGMQGVHRAPRREPGSGVLVGFEKSDGGLPGLAGALKQLADANKIPLVTDYSAGIIPASYLPLPELPAKWVHLGIATSWPDTPVDNISTNDLLGLDRLLSEYAAAPRTSPILVLGGQLRSATGCYGFIMPVRVGSCTLDYPVLIRAFGIAGPLHGLVETYAVSGKEGPLREQVSRLLPPWAKPETDDAGNLILHLGTAPADSKAPKILVVAHMDEIGFSVKSISNDGRLEVETLGGMDLSFYVGHPMLVHTSEGDRNGIMELPRGWDEQNFKWPAESEQTIRVDVGARSPEEVAKLDIKLGDSITIPKEYRPLLGTRANGRSFDDRVGDTALISAVWALGGPLKDRDVTFVWSTGEELGLNGAAALAKHLAVEGHVPDYVFAVDTLVSSDSPLESKRFGDAEIGKGFAIRAIDNSNVTPRDLVAKVEKLARANQIPYQLGVTGGGNDGSAFVPYGSVDIALGWPLRYSHSPAEVIDIRDVDSLARIITVIARSW
jgi:putative aminopeptidase